MFGWQTTTSRWPAIVSTVIGSFGLGIWVGKRLLASQPPVDWFLDIALVLTMLFWTVRSAIQAGKNLPLDRL
jgi:hypothetical protein